MGATKPWGKAGMRSGDMVRLKLPFSLRDQDSKETVIFSTGTRFRVTHVLNGNLIAVEHGECKLILGEHRLDPDDDHQTGLAAGGVSTPDGLGDGARR